MNKEIKNLKINDKAFENAINKEKRFRKRIITLALATSLVVGGYIFQEPIKNQIDIHFYLKDTPSFDELDVFFEEKGIVTIDNKEYDIEKLKEEYGPLYYFMMPMSDEEIDTKFKMITDHQKRVYSFYGRNNLQGDMYGFLIELPFEVEDRMMVHFTSYIDKMMSLKTSAPNQDFLKYISKRVSCMDPVYEQPRACFLNSDSDYADYINGQKRLGELSYESKEFEVKKAIFYFRLYYDFLTAEGYDLSQYKINQDFLNNDKNMTK
ncbi:MAG: hypothetical protein LRY26_00060 [Bacilli bacterium]|nr:hypothetical protein [Bacilli bacterium]